MSGFAITSRYRKWCGESVFVVAYIRASRGDIRLVNIIQNDSGTSHVGHANSLASNRTPAALILRADDQPEDAEQVELTRLDVVAVRLRANELEHIAEDVVGLGKKWRDRKAGGDLTSLD
jgi:hypothetical protein